MAKVSLIVGFVAAVAVLVPVNGQQYSRKFASMDLEKILTDPSAYRSYLNCLKSTGECSPAGQALKAILPAALANGCAMCSDDQKQKVRRVLLHLIQNKPNDYAELEKIYDPSGVARARLQKSG